MTTFAAAKFKAQCLALIDKVARTHEPLIVTKHGKPLVKIVPVDETKDLPEKPLKNKATYIGDVISPIDEQWDADR